MKKELVLLILLGIVLIALPHHLRFTEGNTHAPGEISYYHLLTAQDAQRDLLHGHPYHYLLEGALQLGVAQFLSPFFALLSLLLLVLLFNKIDAKRTPWIILVYVLSPSLLTMSMFVVPDGFLLCLLLIGFYLLFTRVPWLSIIPFFLFALAGDLYVIFVLLAIWLAVALKQTTKKFAGICTALFIPLLLRSVPLIRETHQFTDFFSELGGVFGLGLFSILLALVGIGVQWQAKQRHYGAFVILLASIVLALFYPMLLPFINIVVAFFAGIALHKLAERKWTLKFLRNASLLVIFCGLLFSSIAHSSALAQHPPRPVFFESLPIESQTILTHASYGLWLAYAGHTPITHSYSSDQKTIADVNRLFHTTDVEEAQFLLRQYNVTLLLITDDMIHGLTWERPEQGLHFLTRHETFKKIHDGKGFSIWRITHAP